MKLYKILTIKLLLFLGQRTFIGRGQFRKLIIKLIRVIIFKNINKNSIQDEFVISILNVPFVFFIDKSLGYKLYFCRNERKEIFFIKKCTTDNSIFFDIGANIGKYTQMVAANFDKIKNSTIIAIEPDPLNCIRIKKNLKLLEVKIPNIYNLVKIEECAVGEFNREMYLTQNFGPANNKLSNVFSKDHIKIKVRSLLDIIETNKISHITNLKIIFRNQKVQTDFLKKNILVLCCYQLENQVY